MQMPALLQAEIEKVLEGMPAQAVRAAAQSLSLRYRQGEKNPDGANLLRSETEIAAYAAFRMPATYAALVTALRMAEESGCGEMRTLTDVGAGSGSAYWAAREVFGQPERAVLVERERGMIALGQSLGAQGEGVLWQHGDMLTAELPKAELVTASFCLGELAPQDAERMTARLWDAAEKMLLIVEPGTPASAAASRSCGKGGRIWPRPVPAWATARWGRTIGAITPCASSARGCTGSSKRASFLMKMRNSPFWR